MSSQKNQIGEIATIITLAAFVIIGLSTLASSVFLKNKQTIKTKAQSVNMTFTEYTSKDDCTNSGCTLCKEAVNNYNTYYYCDKLIYPGKLSSYGRPCTSYDQGDCGRCIYHPELDKRYDSNNPGCDDTGCINDEPCLTKPTPFAQNCQFKDYDECVSFGCPGNSCEACPDEGYRYQCKSYQDDPNCKNHEVKEKFCVRNSIGQSSSAVCTKSKNRLQISYDLCNDGCNVQTGLCLPSPTPDISNNQKDKYFCENNVPLNNYICDKQYLKYCDKSLSLQLMQDCGAIGNCYTKKDYLNNVSSGWCSKSGKSIQEQPKSPDQSYGCKDTSDDSIHNIKENWCTYNTLGQEASAYCKSKDNIVYYLCDFGCDKESGGCYSRNPSDIPAPESKTQQDKIKPTHTSPPVNNQITWPDIKLPEIKLPEIKLPDVKPNFCEFPLRLFIGPFGSFCGNQTQPPPPGGSPPGGSSLTTPKVFVCDKTNQKDGQILDDKGYLRDICLCCDIVNKGNCMLLEGKCKN